MAQENELKKGTILTGSAGKYEIQQKLGSGTFGITYLATTTMQGPLGSIKIKVAIKEFFMHDINGRSGNDVTCSSASGSFVYYKEKFRKEAANLSKMHHKNIIKIVEMFEANCTCYYVMEYLPDGNLNMLINRTKGLSPERTVFYALQICSAISYMHSKKMLHLDLKPGNVMIDAEGNAQLIDFGLSKQYDENGNPESSTKVGGGTPGYAPIEQSNHHDGKGFPVTMDIYAIGGVMFKMLTGSCPPVSSDVLNMGFPAAELHERGVSEALIRVIRKAMAPMVSDRYQTVNQLVQDINRFDTDELYVRGVETDMPKEPDKETSTSDSIIKNTALQNENSSVGDYGYVDESEKIDEWIKQTFKPAEVVCKDSNLYKKGLVGYAYFHVVGKLASQADYLYSEQTPFGHLNICCDTQFQTATGEKVASIIGKSIVKYLLKQAKTKNGNLNRYTQIKEMAGIMRQAVVEAVSSLDKAKELFPSIENEKASLAVLLVNNQCAYAINLGGCRICQVRDGRIFSQLRPHTIANYLIKIGEINEDEARHYQINELTKWVSNEHVSKMVINGCDYKKGDRFMICTDGTYNALREKDMIHLLSQEGQIRDVAQSLANAVWDEYQKDKLLIPDSFSCAVIHANQDSEKVLRTQTTDTKNTNGQKTPKQKAPSQKANGASSAPQRTAPPSSGNTEDKGEQKNEGCIMMFWMLALPGLWLLILGPDSVGFAKYRTTLAVLGVIGFILFMVIRKFYDSNTVRERWGVSILAIQNLIAFLFTVVIK